MSTVFSNQLSRYEGKEVTLAGWVPNLRSSGKIWFLECRDGAGFGQVIVDAGVVDAASLKTVEALAIESAVIVTGTVVKHPQKDEYELRAKSVKLVGASSEYPIGKKDHGPDFLLDNRHLWLRSDKQWAIQRVRDTIITATYNYFHENDFVKFDTPILTPTSCEGTTELFE